MNPFAHFEDQFGQLQLSDNDAALHVFIAGWNSAMMGMMKRVNKMPFGDDTRASFAVYFQSQMVNVDAIEKPAQQEPVARVLSQREMAEAAKRYTSPPTLSLAQRKPLTDEQIDAAVKAWFENDIVSGRQPFAKRMRAAIEAAHGIKENA